MTRSCLSVGSTPLTYTTPCSQATSDNHVTPILMPLCTAFSAYATVCREMDAQLVGRLRAGCLVYEVEGVRREYRRMVLAHSPAFLQAFLDAVAAPGRDSTSAMLRLQVPR